MGSEDRHVALLAQAPADLDSVELRQAQVQDHRVGLEDLRLLEGGLSIRRQAHLVPLHSERTTKCAGDIGVVLHDQDSRPFAHAPQDREGRALHRRKPLYQWQSAVPATRSPGREAGLA